MTSTGYWRVFAPNNPMASVQGYVLEHRLIMGETLGRPLKDWENVHHRDGNRGNNKRSNLELWVRMQPCGQRPADLVRFAKKILALYG